MQEAGATVYGGIRAGAGFTSAGTLRFSGARVHYFQSTIAGGIRASGSFDIMHGGMSVSGTGARFSGGLHVSQVGLSVVHGGLNVLQAGAVVSGGERVASGGVMVHGIADIAGVAHIRGGISSRSTIMIVAGGMRVLRMDGMAVADGLRVADTGVEVAGRFAVSSGETLVRGGLDAKSNGVRVASGVRVRSGGVAVGYGNASFLLDIVGDSNTTAAMRDVSGTTGMAISEIGEVRVSGGAAVHGGLTMAGQLSALNGTHISRGGMEMAGRLLVRSGFNVVGNKSSTSSAKARGGLATSGLPLVVGGGALVVGSFESRVSGGLAVSDSGVDIRSGGATMFGGAVAHAPIIVSASDLSGNGRSTHFDVQTLVPMQFSNCDACFLS